MKVFRVLTSPPVRFEGREMCREGNERGGGIGEGAVRRGVISHFRAHAHFLLSMFIDCSLRSGKKE